MARRQLQIILITVAAVGSLVFVTGSAGARATGARATGARARARATGARATGAKVRTRSVAASSSWSMFLYDFGRTDYDPQELAITPANVRTLHQVWRSRLAAQSPTRWRLSMASTTGAHGMVTCTPPCRAPATRCGRRRSAGDRQQLLSAAHRDRQQPGGRDHSDRRQGDVRGVRRWRPWQLLRAERDDRQGDLV